MSTVVDAILVEAIASTPEELDLRSCIFEPDGVAALTELLRAGSVTRLDLRRSEGLTAEALQSLRDAAPPTTRLLLDALAGTADLAADVTSEAAPHDPPAAAAEAPPQAEEGAVFFTVGPSSSAPLLKPAAAAAVSALPTRARRVPTPSTQRRRQRAFPAAAPEPEPKPREPRKAPTPPEAYGTGMTTVRSLPSLLAAVEGSSPAIIKDPNGYAARAARSSSRPGSRCGSRCSSRATSRATSPTSTRPSTPVVPDASTDAPQPAAPPADDAPPAPPPPVAAAAAVPLRALHPGFVQPRASTPSAARAGMRSTAGAKGKGATKEAGPTLVSSSSAPALKPKPSASAAGASGATAGASGGSSGASSSATGGAAAATGLHGGGGEEEVVVQRSELRQLVSALQGLRAQRNDDAKELEHLRDAQLALGSLVSLAIREAPRSQPLRDFAQEIRVKGLLGDAAATHGGRA